MFEPGTRNTGTAIAGRNIANPIAMVNASVDMLDHLGHAQHARLVRAAVHHVVCERRLHTPDLGGTASSTDVVHALIDSVLEQVAHTPWSVYT